MTNEQLVLRIQAGEKTAENMAALYEANKGLIYAVARKYSRYGELEDMVQEGYFGFNEAVQRYDITAGASFSTYAVKWIRQAVVRYLRGNSSPVRISEWMQGKIKEYRDFVGWWKEHWGTYPPDGEIINGLGVSRTQLYKIRQAEKTQYMESLDMPMAYDETVALSDTIRDGRDRFQELEDKLDEERLKNVLWGVVDGLPEEQPEILRQVYREGKTRKEAAAAIGIETGQVNAQERKALRTLRMPKYTEKIKPYLNDYIYSGALKGAGVRHFRDTWTSATERMALKLLKENDMK